MLSLQALFMLYRSGLIHKCTFLCWIKIFLVIIVSFQMMVKIPGGK